MGLREDAEAARLAGIARREQEKKEKECAGLERERLRREEEQEAAMEAGTRIGIEFSGASLWVEDPPISPGYIPQTHLQLRSDDGVWLRYSCYRDRSRSVQHRWMVVQKCALDDRWVTSSWWSTDLEGIGRQLTEQEKAMKKHLDKHHA